MSAEWSKSPETPQVGSAIIDPTAYWVVNQACCPSCSIRIHECISAAAVPVIQIMGVYSAPWLDNDILLHTSVGGVL